MACARMIRTLARFLSGLSEKQPFSRRNMATSRKSKNLTGQQKSLGTSFHLDITNVVHYREFLPSHPRRSSSELDDRWSWNQENCHDYLLLPVHFRSSLRHEHRRHFRFFGSRNSCLRSRWNYYRRRHADDYLSQGLQILSFIFWISVRRI